MIDDDTVLLRALDRGLSRRGWRVFTSEDIFRATAIAREEHPEVVVLDLFVGEHSGLEILDDLRHDLPSARIICLTGDARVQIAVEAMKRGADDFLEKPISVDKLVAAATANRSKATAANTQHPVAEVERQHIEAMIEKCSGNVSEAARQMRMHRRTLQRKRRRT